MPDARTSRSDEGVMALTQAVLKDIFGLTDETASRMLKIVRNQGQLQDLKIALRSMSGVAYRRLNDVINMSQQAKESDSVDPNSVNPDGYDDQQSQEQSSWEQSTWDSENDDGVREAMTFAGYLITELQYSDEDLRDPAKKQQIMRMMRAGDAQADQLKTRGEKDQKMDIRQEIQQEKDPRRAGLLRKRINLQRQVAMINKELGEPGAEEIE